MSITPILAFEQLLKLLFQVGLIGFGIVLVVSWIRKSKRRDWVFGCILIVPTILLMGIGIYFESNTESNPLIRSDDQVLGTYYGDGLTVALLPGRKYVYEKSGNVMEGTWNRDDWNLTLSTSGQSKEFRIIEFRGDYRLREVEGRQDFDAIGWWEIGMERVSTNSSAESESSASD